MNTVKIHIILCLCFGWLFSVQPAGAYVNPVDELSKNPVKLIENKGQWDEPILFKANIPGGTLFITANALTYALVDESAVFAAYHDRKYGTVIRSHTYRMQLEGSNMKPEIAKYQRSAEYYNYFIGNNSARWKSECYAWGKVVLKNIYDGIDLEILALNKRIKLNFIVKAFANPNQIRLVYEGMDKLNLDREELTIETSVVNIRESQPVSFQPDISSKNRIATSYQLQNNTVSFNVAAYDHTYPLIIDPEIIFGTYSGSIADNWGYTATFDTSGNAFSGGTVHDNDWYPVTTGAAQTVWAGGQGGAYARDAGILKYSPDGKNLLYCTYLGGSSNEGPHSMVCDVAGNLYVMGATWSTNFPVTAGAYSQSNKGESDIYVSKISADGKTLMASTYIGGSKSDGLNGTTGAVPSGQFYDPLTNPLTYNYGDYFRGEIILDAIGTVYVVSSTYSKSNEGFPLISAFQATHGGLQDGCIIKLNSGLSDILFSSYIGGSGFDAAFGIALDNFNTLYVCGGTTSPAIGPASGEFAHHGNVDAYVARITNTGVLIKTICYGTNKYDQAYLIQMDNNYNVFITGQTEGNLPSKGNVTTNNFTRHYITSFNRGLDSVRVSANFGVMGQGFPSLSPSAFLVDICNRVYFSGWGGRVNSQNFNVNLFTTDNLFVTNDAFDKTTDGSDFYLIVFSPNLATVEYATFLGSPNSNDHVDGGTSRFDKEGRVYQSVCGGCGGDSNFPTTPGAHSRVNNSSNCNNALFKMDLKTSGSPPVIKDTLIVGGKTIVDTILYAFPKDTFHFSLDIKDPGNLNIVSSFNGNLLAQFPNFANVTKTVLSASTHRIRVIWPVLCTNAGDTVTLNIVTTNDNCPNPLTSIARVRIVVKPLPFILAPYPECVKHINDSVVKLKWNLDPVSTKNLKSYHIFRKVESGSFTLFRQLNQADTTLYDSTAVNHLVTNYCYYFVTRDDCDALSAPSRMICSNYLEDTATSQGFYFNADTIVYMNAFDTLTFRDSILSASPLDSVNLAFSGTLLSTGRVIDLQKITQPGKGAYSFTFHAACSDISITDTLEFRIFAFDNQCPTPRSVTAIVQVVIFPPPLNSTPSIRCIRKPGGDELVINWGQIPTTKYFSHYTLIRKSPSGAISKVMDLYGDSIFSLTTSLPNHETENYCFAIFPVNVCGTNGDTSEFQCTIRKETDFPPNIPIYTVTVEDNKHLLIRWKKSVEDNFSSFNIYRSHLDGSQETRIRTAFTDSVLVDEEVDVMKQSYCYKIRQVNSCAIENKASGDEACSMVLKGQSSPFEHDLAWNPYIYWTSGTQNYFIYRTQPDLMVEQIASISPANPLFTDDKLNIENGLYFYSVQAVEETGGYGYYSNSNTIELIQKPIVYTPNVFTPNNDQLNDQWVPHPVFVKEYNLKLFNRWGQLVFETNDKHETFNAQFLKDPASLDAYVYLITYTGWDKSTHTQTGNVTVLR
ncbi:MAG: gliding motility-associated C-terminal domain-containing protein [Bacteroidia bacterium]